MFFLSKRIERADTNYEGELLLACDNTEKVCRERRVPDEVGESLVEGPVVGRELGSVIEAWNEIVENSARSCQSSWIHVCCSIPEHE